MSRSVSTVESVRSRANLPPCGREACSVGTLAPRSNKTNPRGRPAARRLPQGDRVRAARLCLCVPRCARTCACACGVRGRCEGEGAWLVCVWARELARGCSAPVSVNCYRDVAHALRHAIVAVVEPGRHCGLRLLHGGRIPLWEPPCAQRPPQQVLRRPPCGGGRGVGAGGRGVIRVRKNEKCVAQSGAVPQPAK